MPELREFTGIRYAAGDLRDLICPPYDVISEAEQSALLRRHPHNAVRLELAPSGEGPEKYREAGRTFEEWLEGAVLSRDEDPSLYVYRQDFTDTSEQRRRVSGVIGALTLEELGTHSGVLPHERTMRGPIEDRLALLHSCPVNVSPIYAIYRGGGGLGAYFDSLDARPPAGRAADDHGVLHRLWAISAPAEIELLRRAVAVGPLVIADGHHRYETALAYHRERSDPGAHDAILCFCVDADVEDLVVLPYHRALRAGIDQAQVVRRLEEIGARAVDRSTALSTREGDGHVFTFVLRDSSFVVVVDADDVGSQLPSHAPEWRTLDVVVLHELVLPRIFGDALEITFARDPDEIARLVDDEGYDCGVLLRALRPAQIVDVARSGERMPQKASYFWPKAATGLVFRSLRD